MAMPAEAPLFLNTFGAFIAVPFYKSKSVAYLKSRVFGGWSAAFPARLVLATPLIAASKRGKIFLHQILTVIGI
jgi:hypothetical protein